MEIYVGNLSFETNEQSLRAHFEPHATVNRVKIMTDYTTGQSKGFAFVTVDDFRQAKDAIKALDGQELEGRALRVNAAREKTDGPRPGGGGGGGGYRPSGGGGGGGGFKRDRY